MALEPWLHQSDGEIGGDILDDFRYGHRCPRTWHNADLVAGFVAGRAQGAVGVGSLLMNPAGQPQACWSVVRAEAVGAPFYTSPMRLAIISAAIMRRIRCGRLGFFLFAWMAVYWG